VFVLYVNSFNMTSFSYFVTSLGYQASLLCLHFLSVVGRNFGTFLNKH